MSTLKKLNEIIGKLEKGFLLIFTIVISIAGGCEARGESALAILAGHIMEQQQKEKIKKPSVEKKAEPAEIKAPSDSARRIAQRIFDQIEAAKEISKANSGRLPIGIHKGDKVLYYLTGYTCDRPFLSILRHGRISLKECNRLYMREKARGLAPSWAR